MTQRSPNQDTAPVLFYGGQDSTTRLGGQTLVDIILERTHTCYLDSRGNRHAWGYGCGTCRACLPRARGWTRWRQPTPRPPAWTPP